MPGLSGARDWIQDFVNGRPWSILPGEEPHSQSLLLVFWEKILLCSLGWVQTCDPLSSASCSAHMFLAFLFLGRPSDSSFSCAVSVLVSADWCALWHRAQVLALQPMGGLIYTNKLAYSLSLEVGQRVSSYCNWKYHSVVEPMPSIHKALDSTCSTKIYM